MTWQPGGVLLSDNRRSPGIDCLVGYTGEGAGPVGAIYSAGRLGSSNGRRFLLQEVQESLRGPSGSGGIVVTSRLQVR